MNEREQWLDGLKVGDEVAVDYGRYSFKKYYIGKVERITPTRRFTISGKGCTFDSSGSEMGKKHDVWSSSDRMYPVTDDIKDVIARGNAISRIESVKWGTFTTQQLLDVLKIISITPTL